MPSTAPGTAPRPPTRPTPTRRSPACPAAGTSPVSWLTRSTTLAFAHERAVRCRWADALLSYVTPAALAAEFALEECPVTAAGWVIRLVPGDQEMVSTG